MIDARGDGVRSACTPSRFNVFSSIPVEGHTEERGGRRRRREEGEKGNIPCTCTHPCTHADHSLRAVHVHECSLFAV